MFKLSGSARHFLNSNKSKKIVFTNGCFDIIHSGHVEYLNQAKGLGDLLFVGMNSDKSVKMLKGDERPLNRGLDRKLEWAAISFSKGSSQPRD